MLALKLIELYLGHENVIKFILEYILNNIYNSATSIQSLIVFFQRQASFKKQNLAPFSAEHTSLIKDKIFWD